MTFNPEEGFFLLASNGIEVALISDKKQLQKHEVYSMTIRILAIICLSLVGKTALSSDTILASSVSNSTFQIGNKENSESGTGISLGISGQTTFINNVLLLGDYNLTNATVVGKPLRSTEIRGGLGYSFNNNISVWTGVGSSFSFLALLKSHAIESDIYDIQDNQIDLGFSGQYSLAPQLYTDVKVFSSLNDPDETFEGAASIGYQMNFGTIKLTATTRQSVVQSIDNAETRIGLSFSTNH